MSSKQVSDPSSGRGCKKLFKNTICRISRPLAQMKFWKSLGWRKSGVTRLSSGTSDHTVEESSANSQEVGCPGELPRHDGLRTCRADGEEGMGGAEGTRSPSVFARLPPELLQHIFQFLNHTEIKNLRSVCTYFLEVSNYLLNRSFHNLWDRLQQELLRQMPRQTPRMVFKRRSVLQKLQREYMTVEAICWTKESEHGCSFFVGELLDEFDMVLHLISSSRHCVDLSKDLWEVAKLCRLTDKICSYYYRNSSTVTKEIVADLDTYLRVSGKGEFGCHGNSSNLTLSCSRQVEIQKRTNNAILAKVQTSVFTKIALVKLLNLANFSGRLAMSKLRRSDSGGLELMDMNNVENATYGEAFVRFTFPSWILAFLQHLSDSSFLYSEIFNDSELRIIIQRNGATA